MLSYSKLFSMAGVAAIFAIFVFGPMSASAGAQQITDDAMSIAGVTNGQTPYAEDAASAAATNITDATTTAALNWTPEDFAKNADLTTDGTRELQQGNTTAARLMATGSLAVPSKTLARYAAYNQIADSQQAIDQFTFNPDATAGAHPEAAATRTARSSPAFAATLFSIAATNDFPTATTLIESTRAGPTALL